MSRSAMRRGAVCARRTGFPSLIPREYDLLSHAFGPFSVSTKEKGLANKYPNVKREAAERGIAPPIQRSETNVTIRPNEEGPNAFFADSVFDHHRCSLCDELRHSGTARTGDARPTRWAIHRQRRRRSARQREGAR